MVAFRNISKKPAIVIAVIVIAILVAGGVLLSRESLKNPFSSADKTSSKPSKITENSTRAQEAALIGNSQRELEFAVIRVLPEGFSPAEVTINPGMIVRFTNPTDKDIKLKWDGDVQYTTMELKAGVDAGSIIFDKLGAYTFVDSANSNASGKVIVEEKNKESSDSLKAN